MYESEITKFLRELKAEHPGIELEQKKGRAIWWDKEPMSLDEAERISKASVAQQPYVYSIKG